MQCVNIFGMTIGELKMGMIEVGDGCGVPYYSQVGLARAHVCVCRGPLC